MGEVTIDGGDQFGDATKAAFADDVVGELAKKCPRGGKPGGHAGTESERFN